MGGWDHGSIQSICFVCRGFASLKDHIVGDRKALFLKLCRVTAKWVDNADLDRPVSLVHYKTASYVIKISFRSTVWVVSYSLLSPPPALKFLFVIPSWRGASSLVCYSVKPRAYCWGKINTQISGKFQVKCLALISFSVLFCFWHLSLIVNPGSAAWQWWDHSSFRVFFPKQRLRIFFSFADGTNRSVYRGCDPDL